MAHGDVNVLKGRDQALRVSKTTGAKPASETTGSLLMVGDTSFELNIKNNTTAEDCRGLANIINVIGTADISVKVNYSSLLTCDGFTSLKKAAVDRVTVWAGKQMIAGLDYNGLWYVTEFTDVVGLDESVKGSFSLVPAGVIQFPATPRPLTA